MSWKNNSRNSLAVVLTAGGVLVKLQHDRTQHQHGGRENGHATCYSEEHTEVTLRCEVLQHIWNQCVIYPSARQIKRARKELCGISDCACGAFRGPQMHNGKRLVVDTSSEMMVR